MTNPRFNIEGEQLQSLSSVPPFSSSVFWRRGLERNLEKNRKGKHTLLLYCRIDREFRRPPQAAQPEPPPQPEP